MLSRINPFNTLMHQFEVLHFQSSKYESCFIIIKNVADNLHLKCKQYKKKKSF